MEAVCKLASTTAISTRETLVSTTAAFSMRGLGETEYRLSGLLKTVAHHRSGKTTQISGTAKKCSRVMPFHLHRRTFQTLKCKGDIIS
jgi:hypothetical protein